MNLMAHIFFEKVSYLKLKIYIKAEIMINALLSISFQILKNLLYIQQIKPNFWIVKVVKKCLLSMI